MTQVKSKKTKYANKVEEQIVDAIKSGKSLSGKVSLSIKIVPPVLMKIENVDLNCVKR